jgi:eukaryotic-like serine/threonine-protein kinase
MLRKDESLIGKQIGHYRILEKLGAGGMGEVYIAQDTKLTRKVALKILRPELGSSTDRLQRFEREAKAVAALNHPNIVTLFSVEQSDELKFITMELIQGKTLSKLIPNQGTSLNRFLDLSIPIVDAISMAHQQGIIHRDLKPDNIMVSDEGRIKILDFGLAKLKMQPSSSGELAETGSAFLTGSVTEQGVILGTVAFMSPEQAEGKEIDYRSDIFSIGVIFYEMLTGKLPFQGASAASLISSILRDTPRPVTELNPSVPSQISKIVRRCLEKEPSRRYQSTLDIRNELEEVSGELKSGELLRSGTVAAPTGRKRSFVSYAIVALLLLIAGLIAFLVFQRNRVQNKPLTVINMMQVTEEADQDLFPSISSDAKTIVYASRASDNWDIYLQRIGGKNRINLTQDSKADNTQPAFSPDGERIVFRSEREGGGLFLMGSTGESILRLTDGGYNPVWAPNGKQIAFATGNVSQPIRRPTVSELWSVEMATGKKRLISKGDAVQPNYSPGGYRIAFWAQGKESGQSDIFTIPASGGEPVAITNDAAFDWNPVWSPDGSLIYFCSDRGGSMNIWKVSVDEKSGRALGQPEPVTTGAAAGSQHLTLSKDGRHIAYVARVETKNILKTTFDALKKTSSGEPSWVTHGSKIVAWPNASPDNKWVGFSSEGKQEDIFIIHPDGTGVRQLTNDSYKDRAPRWSPDGNTIAFFSDRSGKYEIWTIHPDGSGLNQLTHFPGAHYPVWSQDGTQMAFSHHHPNSTFIWPLKTGKPFALPALPDATQTFEAWSWSPDGKELAGIRHLDNGDHVGILVYSFETGKIDSLTDFGEWPIWLKDNRTILFLSKDKIYSIDRQSKEYREITFASHQQIVGAFGISSDEKLFYLPIDTTQADIWMIQLGEFH